MFKKRASTNIIGLIGLFRIISISLTLSIYLLKGLYEKHVPLMMLFIAFCVVVSAFIFNYLYKINLGNARRLHMLLIMEISGISFLILFTGGLNSPFIWCFFNPLLIISALVPKRLKVTYLVANFILLCSIGYLKEASLGVREYMMTHSNIILSYMLILILINILLHYSRLIEEGQDQLREANSKLIRYNVKIEMLIQDVLAMYEAVQFLPGQREIPHVVQIMLDFASRAFPKSKAFYVSGEQDGQLRLFGSDTIDDITSRELLRICAEAKCDGEVSHGIMQRAVNGQTVLFAGVGTVKCCGYIGYIVSEADYQLAKIEYDAALLLYSELCEAFFNKIEDDAVSHKLLILDEQNRIADDIHDSVIQRLFAASCLTYNIVDNWDSMPDVEKKEHISMVMETIRSSLVDLRSTIYNLSSKKQGVDHFAQSAVLYLKELEQLSGIKIDSEFKGELDGIKPGAKKAIYRIISEGVGNAIKHSGCENIEVRLTVGETHTSLLIADDGKGIDIEKAWQQSKGLGLYNIKSLVRMFNGSIEVLNKVPEGTDFRITFPNTDIMKCL